MPLLDIESLSSSLPGDAPCGADLEYDADFLAMQEAGAGKPERQYGDNVYPAEEPEWQRAHELAEQLAQRTRDLRVAVWLTRSGARVGGLAGAVAGLRLVQGLIERQWDHVYPVLDASDDNDPTARMNALAPLADAAAGLADLRAAGLTSARGSLSVRGLELALGRAEAMPGEAVPSEEGALGAVRSAIAAQPELAETMRRGAEAAVGIAQGIELRLGAATGPDFAPLKRLLQRVADAATRAQGGSVASEGVPGNDGAPVAALATAGVGAITSRDDVARLLDRACDWIERNEPSNPAPLLIRRAQRLMSKSFLDIIKDLAPDSLNQLERLAGFGND